MSTTNLHAININGDVELYGEVHNSWLGGMSIWNKLNEKYLLNDSMWDQFKKTWGNYNKGLYKNFEDITLGSTFDNVLVKKEDFNQLIEAFKEFEKVHGGTNLNEQVEVIERMMVDDAVIGVGWCQTSVCDDLWDFGYDEDKDESIPYNINKGDKHWFMFDDGETD